MCNFERTRFFQKIKETHSAKLRSTRHLTKSEILNVIASSDDGIEETLLPIPNRTVKLYSADGTAWETVWESRTLLGLIKRVTKVTLFLRLENLIDDFITIILSSCSVDRFMVFNIN